MTFTAFQWVIIGLNLSGIIFTAGIFYSELKSLTRSVDELKDEIKDAAKKRSDLYEKINQLESRISRHEGRFNGTQ
jgi:predicted  nucleic acid-binding Zn-ribbon protein